MGSTEAKRASGNHARGGVDGFVVSGKTVEERYWLPENLGGIELYRVNGRATPDPPNR